MHGTQCMYAQQAYNVILLSYPVFVAPWFLRSVYALKYSVYSGIDELTCMIYIIYNCMHSTEP